MNRFISSKYTPVYIALIIGFIVIFYLITPYYTYPDGPTPSPADSRVMTAFKFFDTQYVIDAKESGYNIPHYYRSFFIVDLIFPIIYTLFFLSVFQFVKDKKIYPVLQFFALAGCVFDYLENFSFAIVLQAKGNGLAMLVAGATTFKSIIVAINLLAVLIITILSITKQLHKLPAPTKP